MENSPRHRLVDIKVFISSTFSDLDEERNYVSRVVFGQLRDKYKGLPINEIDLRWGITEEQANNGRVLDLCLQYILDSKPFFIGILGDRYGTIFPSDEVSFSNVVEEYFPKAIEDVKMGVSATEIEMLNGVLRNSEARAIFFIKKNARRYPGETPAQWSRLENLKDRIRSSGHPVVEYTKLEDFDIIEKFIEKHVGSPSVYELPSEGMQRADAISRRHFERSLEYVRAVPYDTRLDSLLQIIDDTVSKSKQMCAVVGMNGVGKSTTLAYMMHNFTGERIYVPIYGDIDEMPSTSEEISVFLKNALKNAMLRQRKRRTKWHQVKEWFRDGLKEIDYENINDLVKEFLRHKWCFVLDNIDSAEWYNYSGFGTGSLSKPRLVYDKILFYFILQSHRLGKSFDVKLLLSRDMSMEQFRRLVDWSDEPIFDLNQNYWFQADRYVNGFMASHCKALLPEQYKALVSAPIHWVAGHMQVVCNYMVEYLKFDEIGGFVDAVKKNTSAEFIFSLYADILVKALGKFKVVESMILLSIFRDGISLQEFERQSEVSHLDFLYMLQQLKPFTIMSRNGIRFRDLWTQQAFQQVLNIPDKMILDKAQYLAQKYHSQLFENDSFEYFKSMARSRFWEVANCFDDLMDIDAGQCLLNIQIIGRDLDYRWMFKRELPNSRFSNEEKKLREKEEQKHRDDAINQFRINYWSNDGRLTDEIIKSAYRKLSQSGSVKWRMQESLMRNYLQACYAAHMTDWLMATVHNPHFIKKLWDFPLYIFIWDVYLQAGNEFAAPYSCHISADAYDLEKLMRILDIIQHTFYSRIIKPAMAQTSKGSINIADLYLKNYKQEKNK